MLTLDGMPLTLICLGQVVRAQSSAEAEVYAGVMGIKESIHVQELFGWIGEPVRIRLREDATAARSVLSHQADGRVRHLEVKVFWLGCDPCRKLAWWFQNPCWCMLHLRVSVLNSV